MRPWALVLAMLVASGGAAEARCADDMQEFQTRLERTVKAKPTAQTAAATKVLKQYNESTSSDEVDCYNALARARRALNAPDAIEKPKPGNDLPPRR